MNLIPESPEGLVGIASAVIAAAFTLSKVVTSWKSDAATGGAYDAMKATVEGLASEIERLAKQNKDLAEKTNKYQLQIIRLNDEIIELRTQLATRCASCEGRGPHSGITLKEFLAHESAELAALTHSARTSEAEVGRERRIRIIADARREERRTTEEPRRADSSDSGTRNSEHKQEPENEQD